MMPGQRLPIRAPKSRADRVCSMKGHSSRQIPGCSYPAATRLSAWMRWDSSLKSQRGRHMMMCHVGGRCRTRDSCRTACSWCSVDDRRAYKVIGSTATAVLAVELRPQAEVFCYIPHRLSPSLDTHQRALEKCSIAPPERRHRTAVPPEIMQLPTPIRSFSRASLLLLLTVAPPGLQASPAAEAARAQGYAYSLDPTLGHISCTGEIPGVVTEVTSAPLSSWHLAHRRQIAKPCAASCKPGASCVMFELEEMFGGFQVPCYWQDRAKAVYACCKDEMALFSGDKTHKCTKVNA